MLCLFIFWECEYISHFNRKVNKNRYGMMSILFIRPVECPLIFSSTLSNPCGRKSPNSPIFGAPFLTMILSSSRETSTLSPSEIPSASLIFLGIVICACRVTVTEVINKTGNRYYLKSTTNLWSR